MVQDKSKQKLEPVVENNVQNQVLRGRVVAAKQLKTATVLVEGTKTHPLYGKSYVYSKRFLVDDALGVKEGDLVEIVKIRPVSKNKHFKILKIVGQDFEAIATEQLKEEVSEAIEEVMPAEKEAEVVAEEVKEEEAIKAEDKKPVKKSKKEQK